MDYGWRYDQTSKVLGAELYYEVRGNGPLLLIGQSGDGDADRSADLFAVGRPLHVRQLRPQGTQPAPISAERARRGPNEPRCADSRRPVTARQHHRHQHTCRPATDAAARTAAHAQPSRTAPTRLGKRVPAEVRYARRAGSGPPPHSNPHRITPRHRGTEASPSRRPLTYRRSIRCSQQPNLVIRAGVDPYLEGSLIARTVGEPR
jgi:hypothetical protein